MASIIDFQKKSGAFAYASVFGKSTIDANSPEYVMIEQAVELLVRSGYGIIHGGYAGGAMAAASDTANRLIKELKLLPEYNIGVPQAEHDGLWERVGSACFTDVAEDIYTRLKIVASGDIAVVCPLGGDGTELEENIVFHENVVREVRRKNSNVACAEPIPLIFLQTPSGTNWKKLIETKLAVLATDKKAVTDYAWLYFADSIEEFRSIIERLKN